jgi:hypothetical protein
LDKAPSLWRRGISFDAMVIGLLVVVFGATAAVMPAQNDTFWHLRAGSDIWHNAQIPRTDNYSHTFAGTPWPDHEWLSQAIMYAAYHLGGMRALTLLWALLAWGSLAVIYNLMVGPRMTRAVPFALGLMIGCCIWAVRPHMLSLFLMVVLARLIVQSDEHPRRLWIIPPLFVAWANAHGGVVLGGLVLSGAWGAAALRWRLRRQPEDLRRLRTLSVIVPLAGLATAATPLGFGIYRFVIESTARSYAARITEWFPPWPTDLLGVLFWIGALGFVAALIGRRRALAGADWPTWALLGATLVLMPLAFRSTRNVGPFSVLAIPAISRVLGAEFRFRLRRRPRPESPDHPLINLSLVGGLGFVALLLIATAWILPAKMLGWNPIPAGALSAIEACRGPLYNHYNEGGYLIWFTPDRPVFVDGRQDPFPLAFMQENSDVEHEKRPYQPLFERWGIRCAFLSATSPTAKKLGADGWRRRFGDKDWVVYEAPASEHARSD